MKAHFCRAGLALALPRPALAQPCTRKADPSIVNAYVQGDLGKGAARMAGADRPGRDAADPARNMYNVPPPAEADEDHGPRNRGGRLYPADGLIGDWKSGERDRQERARREFTTDPPGHGERRQLLCLPPDGRKKSEFGTLGPRRRDTARTASSRPRRPRPPSRRSSTRRRGSPARTCRASARTRC